jgi:hypothetical protein
MKIISHRGNLKGIVPNKENRPSYIDSAIGSGYEVEVDIRYINGEFWLGHDIPDYKIDKMWIINRINDIWYHCKNLDAAIELKKLNRDIKYFCHSQDSYIITSTNHFWVHDLSLKLDENCIIPLLDEESVLKFNDKIVYAVCTDYVDLCKFSLKNKGLY